MKLLWIPFILVTASLHGQDAREIINRYLDTVSNGNIDNWNKIKSTYSESEVYYSQQDFEQKINFLKAEQAQFQKSYRAAPHNHKIEIYADSTFMNKVSTFYFLKNKTILLLGNAPPIIKRSFAQDEDYLSDHIPVEIKSLMEKSRSVELLGIKQFPTEGIQCYEIRISTKDRNRLLYINTDTFLLEYWNLLKDGEISFLVKFSDYRRIDGFLMPMSDYAMRNGIVYHWKKIRKIEINADIRPEIFQYDEK